MRIPVLPCRFLLLILLVLPMAAPASTLPVEKPGVGKALVLIAGDDESGPALSAEGLFLVARLPDAYLAFLDDGEFLGIESSGLPCKRLISKDDGSREYLIAYDHDPGHPLAEPPAEVAVIHQGLGYRILSLPAELLEKAPSCVLEIERVFRRPLRFVDRPWAEGSGTGDRVADPAISAMVNAVTQADLQAQVQTLQDFGTRHSQYNGGYLASLWIRDRFLSYGYTDVSFHDYNGWNDNVVCVKPGTVFPDQYVVIGGHYDSITGNPSSAPGADDNATGSTCVLQAARVMAGYEFERSVIFIAFSGEEQGLVGSDAWAADAAAQGLDIVGMINLDMLCYLQGGDAADLDIISNSASQPLRDLAFEAIATYVPGHPVVDGYLVSGSSDHASFWAHGYRAIFLFEDSGSYSPYIHTTSDVIGVSANNFPFMLKNVKSAVAATAVLARPFHIAIGHEPQGHSEEHGPFPLTAQIYSAEPLNPATLKLIYRANGGNFSALPLLPTGQADQFGAVIPMQGHGVQVEYYLTASDTQGNTSTHPDGAPAQLHSFRTGVSFVLVDDAEQNLGWTLGAPGDDADTGLWVRADPVGTSYQPEDDHTPQPGHLCFVTGNASPGDPSGTNDVDGGRTTLMSPIFDLADASWASLAYWRWYTDETEHDDDFRVDISNNGGASWISLETVADSAYPWVRAVFDDLATRIALTNQMRLRFIAEDLGSGSLVEALIDDFEVVAVSDDLSAAETPMTPAARLEIYPNPFNPRTTLRLTLASAGWTELRIYDASGSERATPWIGPLAAGEHELAWNASALPSGLYFARLSQNGQALLSRKMALLK